MVKHSNFLKQSEAPAMRGKSGVVMELKPQEVMAELVAKLAQQMDVKIVPAVEGKKDGRDAVRPNLDRLTVGIDLGDQWSNNGRSLARDLMSVIAGHAANSAGLWKVFPRMIISDGRDAAALEDEKGFR